MLQFFRKNGHQENGKVSAVFPAEGERGPLVAFDDEGLYDIGEIESTKDRSRLSKTLREILTDKAALNYFTQFLESRHGAAYIRCWRDIQTFKQSIAIKEKPEEVAEEKIAAATTTSHKDDQSSSQVDHDSLSVSTDCDSYTADSNSVCDDERTKDICDLTSDSGNNSVVCKSKECLVDFALRIFKKYIALEAPESVKCPEELRRGVIENICDLCGGCFDGVERFVYEVLEKEYFQVFLGSDYFCKHQIDVLTSGNVVLEDILYNETALFYFMEFLEQEGQRALLEFWLAATNFQQQQQQQQQQSFDAIEMQNDAVVLYDKYFSLQAHCPLGFGDKVRLAVEQNICGENGVILDCFHLPLKIVEKILERNHLKPFLASQLFYKYLSELISTVQSCGFSQSFEQDKHSPSDCSSERSFSTNSTFLAMENPTKSKKKPKTPTANMSIDTRELYDPDALWRRKKNHRLSFGRITELGRFETDFEPEPDKNCGGGARLKNVVKRWVSLGDEERRREEMAWQVAEMIVKDITSVTLQQKM